MVLFLRNVFLLYLISCAPTQPVFTCSKSLMTFAVFISVWTDFTHCSSISIAYLHWASQRWLVTRWKIYSYVKIVYLSALHFRLYSYLNTICNLQSSLSTRGRLLWEKRVFMLYHRLKYIGWTVHRNFRLLKWNIHTYLYTFIFIYLYFTFAYIWYDILYLNFRNHFLLM